MKGAESCSVPSPVSTVNGSRIISQSQDYWKTCKQRNNKGSTKSVARGGLKDSLKFSQKNPHLHKTRATRKQPTEPVPCWEKAEVAITVLLHHLVHTAAPRADVMVNPILTNRTFERGLGLSHACYGWKRNPKPTPTSSQAHALFTLKNCANKGGSPKRCLRSPHQCSCLRTSLKPSCDGT